LAFNDGRGDVDSGGGTTSLGKIVNGSTPMSTSRLMGCSDEIALDGGSRDSSGPMTSAVRAGTR
jgi:hypothetical protein